MTSYPYGSGFHHEISRGRRLLTGALIGMAAGVLLGFSLGYSVKPLPGNLRLECRDVGAIEPSRLKVCRLAENRP